MQILMFDDFFGIALNDARKDEDADIIYDWGPTSEADETSLANRCNYCSGQACNYCPEKVTI